MKTRILLIFILCLPLFGIAQEKNIFDIARKGTIDEIKAFYQKNPDLINTVDTKKSSPLILACYRGNEAVALYLADKVKDLNYNPGIGTALMAGVMSGNIKIIEKLLSLKADPNQADAQGKTALIYASFFDKNDIVKLLIKAGVNKKMKDADGKTALDYANFNKNTELIILLDN
jgi:uncharacterized protein